MPKAIHNKFCFVAAGDSFLLLIEIIYFAESRLYKYMRLDSCWLFKTTYLEIFLRQSKPAATDYGRPERKKPSLHGRKFTPTPKFLGTAEAYFVCHIGPIFQIYLIYAFIGCP